MRFLGKASHRVRFRPGSRDFSDLEMIYFFFEVFFAAFLVAAFTVFFAFFAFLAMWSSANETCSVNIRAPCIDMRRTETVSSNHKCKLDTNRSRSLS